MQISYSKFSSCYQCQDREVGCHDRCERYQQERQKNIEVGTKVRIEKKKDSYLRERVNDSLIKRHFKQ